MPRSPMMISASRPAFTLIEMIVVIGILLAVAGIGFPLMQSTREASRRDAARALVAAIAAAIADHGVDGEVRVGMLAARLPLWDIDLDGFLDGDLSDRSGGDGIDAGRINVLLGPPASVSDDQARRLLAELGYNGFAATTGFARRAALTGATGRILDPWKRPLRYAYAPLRRQAAGGHVVDTRWVLAIDDADIRAAALATAARFGPRGFAVWSAGADGIDGTPDDIATFPTTP